MIGTGVELPAAFITGDRPLDRPDSVDDGETIRANVGVVALQLAALERQRVIGLLAGNAQIDAGRLPLPAMRIDPAAATTFIGDEVRELVFQGAPKFLGFAVAELRVQLDRAVRPPRTAGGGLHPRIPRDAHLARQFVEGKGFRRLRAPRS